ncbi:MAG: helix-turn-helix domain-containing protein [Pirellulales bacterium]
MLRDPRKIQLARIAIHRQRGELDVGRRLYAELKLHDDEGDWPHCDDCPNELRSLYDLGLSLFACRLFERMGVVYAGELARYSKAELRGHVHLGRWKMIRKIRLALSRADLDLREPAPDEPPPRRPPLAKYIERRYRRYRLRRLRRLSERRKRQILYLVSQNVSEREISRRLGYRSHSTVYAVKREMREKMTNVE